jgi:hypothetical protein
MIAPAPRAGEDPDTDCAEGFQPRAGAWPKPALSLPKKWFWSFESQACRAVVLSSGLFWERKEFSHSSLVTRHFSCFCSTFLLFLKLPMSFRLFLIDSKRQPVQNLLWGFRIR